MSRRPSPAPARALAARAATLGLLLSAGTAWGQQVPATATPATAQGEDANLSRPEKGTTDALVAIDAAYAEKLKGLDVEHLERLRTLAVGLPPRESAAVYEQLFRTAIAADIFAEAEPAADAVIGGNLPSPSCVALAHLVKLIAECDRGDFDQSLKDLAALIATKADANGDAADVLTTSELIGVADAYYQRLIHAGRYDVATRAFQLVLGKAESPQVKDYLASRLDRLKLVGQAAPAIRGVDLDGRPFDLAAHRGKVVLVVFWATWCLPSAAETAWLQETYAAAHAHGFEIVGVNLDPLQDEQPNVAAYIPAVRRFALDYNLRWPILMNGPGDADIARAYGVAEIPASVLIDAEGRVVGMDLVRKNLEPTVSKLLGR
ncbi:TlpA family protein disulfide reductase [Planctomyces sp. SH-PL62]|uniref:TlpA family protein disulfide reductase n=1 Tax=Planctomyces sp. SH-PL62 TaxID=1636152 RepID=UPI00078DB738|nr:TlpA disulfide reductase family protein [Planctomyces sp. SH-PL62]AMV40325.1 Thiol-disulfide oxidoreductase ResA [Planctomyces sp. SH-PL62]